MKKLHERIVLTAIILAMIATPVLSGKVSAAGNLQHGCFSVGVCTHGWATYMERDHDKHRARLWLCSGFGNVYNYNGPWVNAGKVSKASGTRAGVLVHTAAGQTKG